MPKSIIIAALAAFILALPAGALAATKPVPVSLAGVLFNNKENPKVTMKLGGSLRFVWKDGFHNVLTSKAPAKANKVNSGDAVEGHKPIVFKPSKKGKYTFYCAPHKTLGMVLTLTVTLAAHQLRPPSVETSSSPSGAIAYQMRSLRGSEATMVARGPLRCQVAP